MPKRKCVAREENPKPKIEMCERKKKENTCVERRRGCTLRWSSKNEKGKKNHETKKRKWE